VFNSVVITDVSEYSFRAEVGRDRVYTVRKIERVGGRGRTIQSSF